MATEWKNSFSQGGMMNSQVACTWTITKVAHHMGRVSGKEVDTCITVGFTACDHTLGNLAFCVLPWERVEIP